MFLAVLGSLLHGLHIVVLFLLQNTGLGHAGFSSCDFWALEHRLGSCGAEAWLLRGMWVPRRSGIKLMSPLSAGKLFTTKPPGKPYDANIIKKK